MTTRQKVVSKIKEWLGYSVSDGRYKKIIDTYNSYSPLPQGVKMQYGWAWCACTWSAAQIACKTTSVAPIEISCPRIIDAAMKMGCWQENDGYSPKPGDAVLYDWQDNGVGDNRGVPDHIGMVISNDGKSFVVVEGNMSNKVGTRTMKINGQYIRGFITPNYEKLDGVSSPIVDNSKVEKPKDVVSSKAESIDAVAKAVIRGDYGSGPKRRELLEKAGWNYDEVQDRVNKILSGADQTPEKGNQNGSNSHPAKFFDREVAGKYRVKVNLNLRNKAGVDPAHAVVTVLAASTEITCDGYYDVINGIEWLYVRHASYEGFCHSLYLEKVG